jgi:hypothetical protein
MTAAATPVAWRRAPALWVFVQGVARAGRGRLSATDSKARRCSSASDSRRVPTGAKNSVTATARCLSRRAAAFDRSSRATLPMPTRRCATGPGAAAPTSANERSRVDSATFGKVSRCSLDRCATSLSGNRLGPEVAFGAHPPSQLHGASLELEFVKAVVRPWPGEVLPQKGSPLQRTRTEVLRDMTGRRRRAQMRSKARSTPHPQKSS